MQKTWLGRGNAGLPLEVYAHLENSLRGVDVLFSRFLHLNLIDLDPKQLMFETLKRGEIFQNAA